MEVIRLYCWLERGSLLGKTVPAGSLPLNWIDKVMEEVDRIVGRMLNAEGSHDGTLGGQADQAEDEVATERLLKKYP
jgi:hypothetical protein